MKKLIILVAVIFWITSCSEPTTIDSKSATAVITSVSSEDQITFEVGEEIGLATFTYNGNFTLLEINLSGLQAHSEHAMHLHLGTLETPSDLHWNQNSGATFCSEYSQGAEWKKPFAGDIGNISIDDNGEGYFRLSTDLWTIGTGDHRDITETVLFIHEQPEYFGANCGSSSRLLHSSQKIAAGTVELNDK